MSADATTLANAASRARILLAFHWYSEALHEGALRYCLRHNLDARLLTADTLSSIAPGSFDGVVSMLPPASHPVYRFVADASAQVPVVELSTAHPQHARWCRSPSDSAAVGALAAAYLRRQPVSSFVFVAHCAWPTHDARWTAFRSGLRDDPRPCTRFDTGRADDPALASQLDTGVLPPAAIAALGHYLQRLPGPVGVFGSVDQSARHALEAALSVKLRVPQDVCIMGFGNRELLSRVAPIPITSITIDYAAWAYAAVQLLDQRLSGSIAAGFRQPFPPGGIIERASTGSDDRLPNICVDAIRLMNEHVSTPLSVELLAHHLGVSRSSLNRAFRQHFSLGVAEWYVRQRLTVARGLLANGSKVDLVAARVGFRSVRAFRSAFQRHEQQRPSQVKRERRKNNPNSDQASRIEE
jgi:LacI family transcriptional regulator